MYLKDLTRKQEESNYNKNPRDNNSKTRVNATILEIRPLHNNRTAIDLEYSFTNGNIYHKTLEFNKQYNLSNYRVGDKMPIWVNPRNPDDIKTALKKQFISIKGIIKPFFLVVLIVLGTFFYQNKGDIKEFFYEEFTKIGNSINSMREGDNSPTSVEEREVEDLIEEITKKLEEIEKEHPELNDEILDLAEDYIDPSISKEELKNRLKEFLIIITNKTSSSDPFLRKSLQRGETFKNDIFQATYLGIETFNPKDYDISRNVENGFMLALVRFKIKNTSDEELNINRSEFRLFVDGMTTQTLHMDRVKYKNIFTDPDDKVINNYLAPQEEITGYLMCKVPENWDNFYVEYSQNHKVTASFRDTNDIEDSYPFIPNNDVIEIGLTRLEELTVEDINLNITDKHTMEILPKILKIELNIKNGKNKSVNIYELGFKLYVDGASKTVLKQSVLIDNKDMMPLSEELMDGKIAPRSEVYTYLLCFVPNNWEEIMFGYKDPDNSKKIWIKAER